MMNVGRLIQCTVLLGCMAAVSLNGSKASAGPLVAQPNLTQAVMRPRHWAGGIAIGGIAVATGVGLSWMGQLLLRPTRNLLRRIHTVLRWFELLLRSEVHRNLRVGKAVLRVLWLQLAGVLCRVRRRVRKLLRRLCGTLFVSAHLLRDAGFHSELLRGSSIIDVRLPDELLWWLRRLQRVWRLRWVRVVFLPDLRILQLFAVWVWRILRRIVLGRNPSFRDLNVEALPIDWPGFLVFMWQSLPGRCDAFQAVAANAPHDAKNSALSKSRLARR